MARFGVVGGSAAVVYVGCLWLLAAGIGIAPLVAANLAFICAALYNYSLHYHWTFASDRSHRTAFSRFCVMNAVGFLLNGGTTWAGLRGLGWPFVPVQVLAIALVVSSNFLLSAFWVFDRGRAAAEAGPACR
jgi:putative flippase GtrA